MITVWYKNYTNFCLPYRGSTVDVNLTVPIEMRTKHGEIVYLNTLVAGWYEDFKVHWVEYFTHEDGTIASAAGGPHLLTKEEWLDLQTPIGKHLYG